MKKRLFRVAILPCAIAVAVSFTACCTSWHEQIGGIS